MSVSESEECGPGEGLSAEDVNMRKGKKKKKKIGLPQGLGGPCTVRPLYGASLTVSLSGSQLNPKP